MKKILIILLMCPAFSFSQTDSARIIQEKKQIALAASPVFVKANAQVLELKNNVSLAKKGLLKKSDVVRNFNKTVGLVMGKETTFSGVEQRLNKDGDAYVKFLYLKEEARISYLKASEAKYKSLSSQ